MPRPTVGGVTFTAVVWLYGRVCRTIRLHRSVRRIEEAAAPRLVEKFSRDENAVGVENEDETVVVTVGGRKHELPRSDARALHDALGNALTATHEFVRTSGEHRKDGSYVVSRRGANSAGHSKVFESFEALSRLYERLPVEFTAEDVSRSGLTGGRRHMLVHHFAEHPAFDCRLAKRQPLTVRKGSEETDD